MDKTIHEENIYERMNRFISMKKFWNDFYEA